MINVDEYIKQAIKTQDKDKLRAYKNLKANIQLLKTAKNAKPYTEDTEIKLISKMCKNLEDGISSFIEAGRTDLVSEYRSELEILQKLLPEPVDASQIVSELYNGWHNGETIEIPKKEMGNVIKYLKSKFPQVNGKEISDIVKKYIYD